MKKVVILFVVLCSIWLQAQEKKNKNAQYSFVVNGNCETCKKRIENAAYGVKGVKSAVWNIETHEMVVIVNEEKTDLIAVKKAIVAVGHDVGELKADDAVYDKLHHCCKYERK